MHDARIQNKVILLLALVQCEETNFICDEIETLRSEMVSLGIQHGFLHPDVQRVSKQLDQLLVRFYMLDYAQRRLAKAAALESFGRWEYTEGRP
jgi:hypothetical protein